MTKNYIVAIGGSGSRCLGATIYLSASGLFEGDLHVVIVDPDQTNGNAEQVKRMISAYSALSSCQQPERPRQRNLIVNKRLPEAVIFRPSINRKRDSGDLFNYFWQDPNPPDRTFGDAIDIVNAPPQLKNFASLFYETEDLQMALGKGYRGRPNVGAVTLISDLRRTVDAKGNGLAQMIESIRADLIAEKPVRLFVYGSVFGGTGAAGIPTISRLIEDTLKRSNTTHNERMRFGVAMLTPYFSFPEGKAVDGPSPDSALHQAATQAALLHYGHNDPGYQHLYIIGSPEMPPTNTSHSVGGESQENDPHYVEIVASLAARDFFSRDDELESTRLLHYADGDHLGWKTLPSHSEQDQREIRRKLITFTTFAFIYRYLLNDALRDRMWLARQAWYTDNFTRQGYTLETSMDALNSMDQFCESYLEWLGNIGRSVGKDPNPLFNWSAFPPVGSAENVLGKLSAATSGGVPKHTRKAYGHIMDRLSRLTPTYEGDVNPVGLLTYLLYEAVSQFCEDNYGLSQRTPS
jgi:hypothetical protein